MYILYIIVTKYLGPFLPHGLGDFVENRYYVDRHLPFGKGYTSRMRGLPND